MRVCVCVYTWVCIVTRTSADHHIPLLNLPYFSSLPSVSPSLWMYEKQLICLCVRTFSSHLPSNTGVVIAERTSKHLPPSSSTSSLSWPTPPTRKSWTAGGSGRSDSLRPGNGDSGKALYVHTVKEGGYSKEPSWTASLGLCYPQIISCLLFSSVLHNFCSFVVVSHPNSWPLSFMNKTCNLAVAIATRLRQE